MFIDRDFDIPDISMVRSDHYQGAFLLGQNLANVDGYDLMKHVLEPEMITRTRVVS